MLQDRASLVAQSLVATVACSLLLLSAQPARACIKECGGRAGFAPANGAPVPASVPGFPTVGAREAALVVRDADGAVVEGAIEGIGTAEHWKPANPLAPGAYAASWEDRCPRGRRESTFTVVASAPLPMNTGVLRVASSERIATALPTGDIRFDCREDLDAAVVMLDVSADPGLTPYLSVAVWETSVDGAVWAVSTPALDPPSGFVPFGRTTLRLFAACDGLEHSDDGLAPGTHDVEVRAILPGGSRLESAALRVRLSCREKNGEIVAPEGPLEIEPPPSSETQDGCSATPRRSSGSGALAAGLALAFVAIRSRRGACSSRPRRPA